MKPSQKLRPEWVFLIIFLPLSLVIALFLPPGAGFDEEDHIARTNQIINGGAIASVLNDEDISPDFSLIEQPHDPLYGGSTDLGLLELVHKTKESFFNLDLEESYLFPPWDDPHFQSKLEYDEADVTFVFSNTAIYSPVAYAPQAVALFIGRIICSNVYALIMLMRFAQIIAFAAAGFFIIRYIPIGKWLMTVICLMPVTIIQSAAITADMMSTVCCFAFIATILKLLMEKNGISKGTWAALVITSICLGLVKISYLPLILLVVLVPAVRRDYRSSFYVIRFSIIILCSFAVFILWYFIAISGVNTGTMFKSGVIPSEQISYIIQHPLHYLKLLVLKLLASNYFQFNYFGILNYHGVPIYDPSWLMVVILVLATLVSDPREKCLGISYRRSLVASTIMIALFFLVASLIITALYIQFNTVGSATIDGVQPRYFLPILPLLPLSILVPYKVYQGIVDKGRLKPSKEPDLFQVTARRLLALFELFYAVIIAFNFFNVVF